MRDGRILLCSSAKKQEWILPKGGWESDETVEESALRECYEEAGVLGTLGPRLADVEFETRKAKKRRIERESMLRKQTESAAAAASVDERTGLYAPETPLDEAGGGGKASAAAAAAAAIVSDGTLSSPGGQSSTSAAGSPVASALASAAPALTAQRLQQHHRRYPTPGEDDAASSAPSVASLASDGCTSCTHVRMILFPLYVSEVLEGWPESNRVRKVMDLDAAIDEVQTRPEFRAALEEVRARGLHLVGSGRMGGPADPDGGAPGEDGDR